MDEDMYERLKARSQEENASIGALIRRAVDQAYPAVSEERRQAARRFLAAKPPDVEPLDYPELKKLKLSTYERVLQDPEIRKSLGLKRDEEDRES